MARIEIELDDVFLDHLEASVQDSAMATMETLRGEVVAAQVMPFDSGDMQNNLTSVQPLEGMTGARLETDGPYARRLYHHPEYNFQTVNNPNAQGEWLRPWLPGGSQENFAGECFAGEMRRRLPK